MVEFWWVIGLFVVINMIVINWCEMGYVVMFNVVDILFVDLYFWMFFGVVCVVQFCDDWGLIWGCYFNNYFDIFLVMFIYVGVVVLGNFIVIDIYWIWQEGDCCLI